MKLSDMKPCAICSRPLIGETSKQWYVVRWSMAMLDPRAAREVVGLATMFGGHLGLAETFAPNSDAVTIAGDKDPQFMNEIHICFDCYCGRICLAEISERKP